MNPALDFVSMTRDFGLDATLNGVSVRGIFDAPYADAFGVGGSAPQLTVLASDAPLVAIGDAVTIGDASYTVAGVEPDGTGVARLTLRAV